MAYTVGYKADFKSLAVPAISISPYSFSTFTHFPFKEGVRPVSTKSKENLHNNSSHGLLSSKAQRRLKNCIGWLLIKTRNKYRTKRESRPDISKKICFATLTLPSSQIHSDNQIKSVCLNQLFVELSKVWKLKNYVWRAEKQQNHNIHFHILADKFIPYKDLQTRWNRIVNKLGYVDEFERIHGHTNPPSTQVVSLKNVKKISSYISKYISKNDSEIRVDGKLWYASESLLNIKNIVCEIDSFLHSEIEKVIDKIKPFTVETDVFKCYCSSLFEVDLSRFEYLSSLLLSHSLSYSLTH